MKEIFEKIVETVETFYKEANANSNGNKAAGVRARKASSEIEKLMKSYRKASVEANKK